MGYYVEIKDSTAIIPAENKDQVLQIWKDLNKPENDHLKNGGSYSGGQKTKSWFSWMAADYDKTCDTVEEVLDMLGFGFDVMGDGTIVITEYDSKTGQEELFFSNVSHLVTGEITWKGEEGEIFTWKFSDNVLEVEE